MSQSMKIKFPGGKRVDCHAGDFVVNTDQPPLGGGEGSAPSPFTLFLASIGTCAGIYVKGFCDARNLSAEGIDLTQRVHVDPETKKLSKVELVIELPPDFPEKYRKAIERAASMCTVKRTLQDPPELTVSAVQT
jgi:ribosomal protein S12 methylthiotransferase accessory factor